MTRGRWQTAQHLLYLNNKLVKVAQRKTKRLLVTMPPRHGKSSLCSQYFPAWFLGTYPDSSLLFVSYEASFAQSWGRKVRDLMMAYGPLLWGLRVSESTSAVAWWGIQGHDGQMMTAGAGGSITGKGADLLLIDDPVKSEADVRSQLSRDRMWEWYGSTVETRLNGPEAVIVLIMTRWHEDDLAGRLLKKMQEGGEQWEVVKLPALAEEGDPLGRPPGAPLWPEKYPLEFLLDRKRTLGAYAWSALYQQSPAPAEGGLFKREKFRYFEVRDDLFVLGGKRAKASDCWRFCTVDLAASLSRKADYTVVATWAVTPAKDLLLLDLVRVHMESPDIRGLLNSVYQRWQPGYIGIEDAFALSFIQEIRREGLPIQDLKADRDKWSRALPASARMDAGSIYFRANAPWLADFEEELLQFPNGAHDDQVDCLSYAVSELINRRGVKIWV